MMTPVRHARPLLVSLVVVVGTHGFSHNIAFSAQVDDHKVDAARRSALSTVATTLVASPLISGTGKASATDEAPSIHLSSFVPAASDAAVARDYDVILADAGTQFDVFKLVQTPSRKAKVAVQQYGDKYSRVVKKGSADPYDIIGVGITLNQIERGGQIIISAPPMAGSPAANAGLSYGDKVLSINGQNTAGKNVFDVVEQLFENAEAKTIALTVERVGTGERANVVLPRDFSGIADPVSYEVSERRPDGKVVGYINLRVFNSRAYVRMTEAITSLKAQGANAYVIDVRNNGGGSLQSALWTAKLFLGDNKIIMNTVQGTARGTPYRASKSNVLVSPKCPIVVIINKGSASATEIFASALRDNCRALVMGQASSYGKGLIQAGIGLKDGSKVVVTAGKYLTPSGREVQGRGIRPDIKGTDAKDIDFDDVLAKLFSFELFASEWVRHINLLLFSQEI